MKKNLAIVTAALLTALLAACSRQDAPTAERPTPVRIQHASTGPAVPPIDTSGIVTTKHEMRLSFKMGGVVRRIYVQEGDVVKQGQRLAEIELTEVGAQVEQARQMADKALRDLKRGENLYADQVISLEQLQDLRTQAAMASAQFNSAQFNLGYSVITAPRDGKVLRKLAEERELVPAGSPVLVFGESGRGYVVRAALADREIVNVKLGDKGEIRMDAFPRPAHDRNHRRNRQRRRRAHRHVPDRSAVRRAAAAPRQWTRDATAPRADDGSAATHLRADVGARRRRR
jgi:RND family efflux transporter MFP subunit